MSATDLISYDLDRPGQDCDGLISRLRAPGAVKVLYSEWVLRTAAAAVAIRDDLGRFIDSNDMLCDRASMPALARRDCKEPVPFSSRGGVQASVAAYSNVAPRDPVSNAPCRRIGTGRDSETGCVLASEQLFFDFRIARAPGQRTERQGPND
jgi:hypothetical protein